MPLCEYCRKKKARIKYCCSRCCNAAQQISARKKRRKLCRLCRKKPRLKASARCLACGPVALRVPCKRCQKMIKRRHPGTKYCGRCKLSAKADQNAARYQEKKRFQVSCPVCKKVVTGGTLRDHTLICKLPTHEGREWYNDRKKTQDILEVNDWTLGEKTMDQLDKEYFEWRCL